MTEPVKKIETPEDIREAFGVLAAELVNLKAVQEAQGKLLEGMDTRMVLITKLVDRLRAVLEAHGMVPPRPKGVSNVN
jgi:hypothetical protein